MGKNGGCGCGSKSKSAPRDMPSDVRQFLGEVVRNRPRTMSAGISSTVSDISTIEAAALRAMADVSTDNYAQPHISAPGIEQAAQRAVRDVSGLQS